ncbi:MAG: hypothetical protein IJ711_10825 [Lachnospiraceae bacterium]|nr:hypothetical protein [Lachnospiraceae bacterium]
MIAIQITDLKLFMKLLLTKETFDSFLLEEAMIKTGQTYYIDGHTNREFYTKEELEINPSFGQEFSSFSGVRPVCFSLIKGNRTPLSFKFVLHAGEAYVDRLLQKHQLTAGETNLKSLLLTIRYDGSRAVCTTGTAYHTFVMDKTVDSLWDSSLKASFDALGISFEELT